jgi:hypothetical protein
MQANRPINMAHAMGPCEDLRAAGYRLLSASSKLYAAQVHASCGPSGSDRHYLLTCQPNAIGSVPFKETVHLNWGLMRKFTELIILLTRTLANTGANNKI